MKRCETCRWWGGPTGSQKFGDCSSDSVFYAIGEAPIPDHDFGCVYHAPKEAPDHA